jgi:DNA-directed RNA polymerase specialized sigma24 family protein
MNSNYIIEFEDHKGLLMHWAHRVHRRVFSCGGQSTQLQDIFQECCIAWCIARDKWKPEITLDDGTIKQVPFGAYLANGVRNHINRWADKEILEHGWGHLDLDAPLTGEFESDAHGVTPDQSDSAFEILERKDAREQNLECLSADARKFMEILESPPPQIMAILEAQQAKKQFAAERGLAAGFFLKKLSMSLIFDVMGANAKQRAAIMGEVRLIMNLEQMADA